MWCMYTKHYYNYIQKVGSGSGVVVKNTEGEAGSFMVSDFLYCLKHFESQDNEA